MLLRKFLKFSILAYALIIALVSANVSQAQSVADIINAAEKKSDEINRVLSVLQNADQVTQFALVEALLKEKDKALVKIGREHALFSTNPAMQNLAIQSVLNTNSHLRLALTDGETADSLKWVEHVGGTSDEKSGFVLLETGSYDGKCWLQPIFNRCRFSVLGTSVQFQNHSNGGQSVRRAQASLALGADGVLRGPIVSSSGRALLSIDLKE